MLRALWYLQATSNNFPFNRTSYRGNTVPTGLCKAHRRPDGRSEKVRVQASLVRWLCQLNTVAVPQFRSHGSPGPECLTLLLLPALISQVHLHAEVQAFQDYHMRRCKSTQEWCVPLRLHDVWFDLTLAVRPYLVSGAWRLQRPLRSMRSG